ncbi:MAG TPA: DNA-processing protein DprA [Candidatus Limnocylindrales bacterium]|nr:DNA-processing protein DprA [Candidatus Limnocylindrales bacterium]
MIGVGTGGPARASQADREALAVLVSVDRLGPMTLARLLGVCPSPAELLERAGQRHGQAAVDALVAAADPVDRWIADGVAAGLVKAARDRAAILERIAAMGLQIVVEADPDYPGRLRAIELPPPVLFVQGERSALEGAHAVAVVGTRRPTEAGRRTASRIGAALARAGAVVVSGLALGIDGEAHAAVVGAGGQTVAFIGGGHARLFPLAHDRLAEAIVASGGAIVSEHAPDTEPTKGTFPRRNRLISGSADAVVVVEAGARSGALLTASWALEQGRECFLVPGSIDAPMSAGCLGFLRDWPEAARIVAGIPQLLDDLGLSAEAALPAPVDAVPRAIGRPSSSVSPVSVAAALAAVGAADEPVARAMARGAATVDELVAITGRTVPAVLASLTRLETAGLVGAAHGRYRPIGSFGAAVGAEQANARGHARVRARAAPPPAA